MRLIKRSWYQKVWSVSLERGFFRNALFLIGRSLFRSLEQLYTRAKFNDKTKRMTAEILTLIMSILFYSIMSTDVHVHGSVLYCTSFFDTLLHQKWNYYQFMSERENWEILDFSSSLFLNLNENSSIIKCVPYTFPYQIWVTHCYGFPSFCKINQMSDCKL